jgi:hypothetical protein
VQSADVFYEYWNFATEVRYGLGHLEAKVFTAPLRLIAQDPQGAASASFHFPVPAR